MEYLELCGEFLLLFLLSHALTISLSRQFHHLTHNMSFTVYVVSFLFLPGTFLHETAHFAMATILNVRAMNFTLLPRLEGNMVRLGSVDIERPDPFRRMLIGVAPFLVGTTILFGLFSVIFPHIEEMSWWQIALSLFVVFEVANTMFSSRKDLEGTVELLVAVVGICLALYILHVRVPNAVIHFFQSEKTLHIVRTGIMYLLIPILIDIAIIITIRILNSFRRY